jgi:cytochrome c-type biogenesis protein
MNEVPGADFPAAFAAGLISFLSPCVLPLVPGYLSAVTGVQITELDRVDWRRVLVPSLLFVASFSAIFIGLGLSATKLSETLIDNRDTLSKIGGVVLIAMGLLFVSSLWVTRLNREWRIDALMRRAARGGPIVAGAAFSIAWTPCTGPVYGGIVSLASAEGETAYAGLLLAVYCVGLALPFLATALAFSRATTVFSVFKRHYAAIVAVGGLILVGMGVLLLTDAITDLNVEAQRLSNDLGIEL